jgi:hypothetical protein
VEGNVLFQNLPGGAERTRETSDGIDGVPAEIQTRRLLNTIAERYRYLNLLGADIYRDNKLMEMLHC